MKRVKRVAALKVIRGNQKRNVFKDHCLSPKTDNVRESFCHIADQCVIALNCREERVDDNAL